MTNKMLYKLSELPDKFKEVLLPPRPMIEKGWGGHIEDGKCFGETIVWHKKSCFEDPERWEVGTVKVLNIHKNMRLSLHFHIKKTEIFYCTFGAFLVTLVKDGEMINVLFKEGETMLIKPGMVHRMTGIDDVNLLLEVSTEDFVTDSYRIEKGD